VAGIVVANMVPVSASRVAGSGRLCLAVLCLGGMESRDGLEGDQAGLTMVFCLGREAVSSSCGGIVCVVMFSRSHLT
jgi:hypothetical protein